MQYATPKQVNFIKSLRTQAEGLGVDLFKQMAGYHWERLWDLDAGTDADGDPIKFVSVGEASNIITELLGLIGNARKNQPIQQSQPKEQLKPGIYKKGDQFFKVQWNKQHSGTYAKRMEIFGGNRLTEDGKVVHFKWIYEPGLIRGLEKEQFLPVEEVGNLGLQFGNCMVCGRKLVDAYSVQHGIGPVCAKNYGTAEMAE